MNDAVERYFEDKIRAEWMSKLRAHGTSHCHECGHSGYVHGKNGCVAFRDDVPKHTEIFGSTPVSIVDIPADKKMEDYFCGCRNGSMCKSNEQIIFGYELPETRNEPPDVYRGK